MTTTPRTENTGSTAKGCFAARDSASRSSKLALRLSTTMFGLGMVAVLVLVPIRNMLPTSGVEAVTNTPLIALSSPIDGEVRSSPPEFGVRFARGDLVLHIINDRADRTRVDDLAHEIERLKDDHPGIEARLVDARMRLTDLTEQLRLFAEARILQLEARQDELRAELAAAQAKNEEAKTTLERFATLAGKGWTSRAQLNQAQRDGSIAEKSQAAAEKRLEAAGVELSAAQRGVFVGVGSNDRPRYMQRADHLEQEVANLAETLAEHDRRLARLGEQLAGAKARYELRGAADVVAPTEGRIWETLVSSGQQVHRGEVLLRVLDCGRPVVTAQISEAVYHQLQVDRPARFVPHGGREETVGRIVRLSRVAPSNLAIQTSPAATEVYHVTVAMPLPAEGESCSVGRAGVLKFDDDASENAATANVSTPGRGKLSIKRIS